MDHPTAAASSASAVAAVLWASGQPPDAVMLAALAGGVLSVWGDPPPEEMSIHWVVLAMGRLLLSVAVGLTGAAGLPAVAVGYEWLRPIASAPQWVISGVCSLFAPVIVSIAKGRLAKLDPPAVPERNQ